MTKFNKEFGQTLLETVVGIFVLIMGISSAVGLANYSLNSTANVTRQLIGVGLAREGAEAVRNMRDTNWLKDTLSVNGCTDLETNTPNAANCYKDWLGGSNNSSLYCIDPTNNNGNCNGSGTLEEYYLGFTYNENIKEYEWIFRKDSQYYGLNYDDANSNGTGFYFSSSDTPCVSSTSDYCRSVKITKVNTAPYNTPDNTDIGPLLLVQSRVWWVAKNCPRVATFASAQPSCRVELTTHLTNWKNY